MRFALLPWRLLAALLFASVTIGQEGGSGYWQECSNVLAIPGNPAGVTDCSICNLGAYGDFPCNARTDLCYCETTGIPSAFVNPFTYCERAVAVPDNDQGIDNSACSACNGGWSKAYPCNRPEQLCTCAPGHGFTAMHRVSVFAGAMLQKGSDDGQLTSARFRGPTAIAGTSSRLFLMDNKVSLREIYPSLAKVSTLTTNSDPNVDHLTTMGDYLFLSLPARHFMMRFNLVDGSVALYGGKHDTPGFGTAEPQSIDAARFNQPTGLCSVDGDVFVSDKKNCQIRTIDTKTDVIRLFAGSRFRICGHSNSLINRTTLLTIPSEHAKFHHLFFVDQGNHRIRKVDITGAITDIIGTGSPGTSIGSHTQARVPSNVGGLAARGRFLYFTATDLSQIRRVDLISRITSIIAGNSCGSLPEGFSHQNLLCHPQQLVALDTAIETLLVVDTLNDVIRMVQAAWHETTATHTLEVPHSHSSSISQRATLSDSMEISSTESMSVFHFVMSDNSTDIRPTALALSASITPEEEDTSSSTLSLTLTVPRGIEHNTPGSAGVTVGTAAPTTIPPTSPPPPHVGSRTPTMIDVLPTQSVTLTESHSQPLRKPYRPTWVPPGGITPASQRPSVLNEFASTATIILSFRLSLAMPSSELAQRTSELRNAFAMDLVKPPQHIIVSNITSSANRSEASADVHVLGASREATAVHQRLQVAMSTASSEIHAFSIIEESLVVLFRQLEPELPFIARISVIIALCAVTLFTFSIVGIYGWRRIGWSILDEKPVWWMFIARNGAIVLPEEEPQEEKKKLIEEPLGFFVVDDEDDVIPKVDPLHDSGLWSKRDELDSSHDNLETPSSCNVLSPTSSARHVRGASELLTGTYDASRYLATSGGNVDFGSTKGSSSSESRPVTAGSQCSLTRRSPSSPASPTSPARDAAAGSRRASLSLRRVDSLVHTPNQVVIRFATPSEPGSPFAGEEEERIVDVEDLTSDGTMWQAPQSPDVPRSGSASSRKAAR